MSTATSKCRDCGAPLKRRPKTGRCRMCSYQALRQRRGSLEEYTNTCMEIMPSGVRRMVTKRACQECGVIFSAPITEVQRGRGLFCSISCSSKNHAHLIPHGTAENHPRWLGGDPTISHAERWYERNPGAEEAHRKVKYAKKKGSLLPEPCSVCGTSEKVQAHHPDYSKPLDVVWLCQLHHRKTFRKGQANGD